MSNSRDHNYSSNLTCSQYCTSGDLGTLIRRAQRNNSFLPEDKIWNIFLQIVLALHHCHWPAERPANTGGRQSVVAPSTDGGVARYQVLHRDLKPENGMCRWRSNYISANNYI